MSVSPPPLAPDTRKPHGTANRAVRALEHEVIGRAERNAPHGGSISPDALLIAALTLFNESTDLDATLRKTLTILTMALDGRIGLVLHPVDLAPGAGQQHGAGRASVRAAAVLPFRARAVIPVPARSLAGRWL